MAMTNVPLTVLAGKPVCCEPDRTRPGFPPTSVQSGGKGLFFKNYPVVHVVTQFFEFPGGKEIGRGKYMIRFDDDRQEFVRDDLAAVAKEFAAKTSMPK
jgi:hypothetical protein